MFSTHGSVKDQIVPLGISYVIEKQFKIDAEVKTHHNKALTSLMKNVDAFRVI